MNQQPVGATLNWSTELHKAPTWPPVVVGRDVLLATREGGLAVGGTATIQSIDGRSGHLRWEKAFARSSVSGLLVLPAPGLQLLITLCSHDLLEGRGGLMALDSHGRSLWSWWDDVQAVSAPAAHNQALYVTTDTASLIILDAARGHELHRFPLDGPPSLAAPLVHGEQVYVPCRGPALLALTVRGERLWQFGAAEAGWTDSTPLRAGDHLIAVTSAGIALALEPSSGQIDWQRQVDPAGRRLSAPCSDGERLYVGAHDGLHALNVADGHSVWHFPTRRPAWVPPVCQDGTLYAVSHDHHLYALDAATGTELWRYEMGRRIEVSPAVRRQADGPAVLAADRGGTLVALALFPEVSPGAASLQEKTWAAAAARYVAEEAWTALAAMWDRLERPLEKAQALKRQAESLRAPPAKADEMVAAWEVAAVAFEEASDWEQAGLCRRHVAQHYRLPILSLDVEHEELVLDAWSRLKFTVHNQGFGPAYRLVIRVEGERFDGQVTATRTITSLAADQQRTDWLDLRPREYGKTVPLRVTVSYEDVRGEAHSCTETVYLSIAPREPARAASLTQILGVFNPLRHMGPEDTARVVHLREKLMAAFSKEELFMLAFELGLDHEAFSETKGGFVRELLLHLWRHQRLDELVALCQARRPQTLWEEN